MDDSFFDKTLYGATFSVPSFTEKHLNWRDCLDYMQDALPEDFNFLRIGAYWAYIQPAANQYVWDELDEVIDAIENKGRYNIVLSVGMKAPRWPEYYIPTWALPNPPEKNSEISKDVSLRIKVLDFIAKTVERYRGRAVIKAWQVENEPMDRAGEGRWFIGADFVAEEAARIRSLDSRPLIINCWSENQTFSSQPWGLDGDYAVKNALNIADILGLDIYATVDGRQIDFQNRCQYLPTEYIKRAINMGKKAIVAESQAEPWGNMTTPEDIRWLMDQHIGQGYRTVLMWGLEWWYEQVIYHHDDSIFRHINWETKRFSMLSRVNPEWSTNHATDIVQHNSKLFMTVVGHDSGIWLFSSANDGQTWNTSRVPDANWITMDPVGLASHNGQLFMTIVGDNDQAWLLSSQNDGYSWKTTQIMGDWQTPRQMNMASLNGILYVTMVGNLSNEVLLLASNDNGATFSSSHVLGDWQTQQPIDIAVHNGDIYMTVVGYHDSSIWLIKYSIANQTYSYSQVMGGADNWHTHFPVGITSHDGKLYLAVVGDQQSEILLLRSSDNGQNWDVSPGIFDGWTTSQAIALTEYVNPSNQRHLHASLIGSTAGEIYLCTKDPILTPEKVLQY
ncbi:hypothetical protein KDA_44490 [Dictyobacter alpinus]|uniref:Glycoside hydrolase family 42 N-terminal domain-containing protein n=1 Tax=Dictyobacter alpinus TaxID=2014873 RepID=A0A402BC78_9CHLR|nr:beta-galactosidase [Dictyobacter alpinus]GCE28965.1 hypothetical protein KDA_44490 [Dictyobacter alpinus]